MFSILNRQSIKLNNICVLYIILLMTKSRKPRLDFRTVHCTANELISVAESFCTKTSYEQLITVSTESILSTV